MEMKRIVCGAYQENAYFLENGLLIDPGDDLNALLAAGEPKAILLTHGHFDHMLAVGELQKRFGVDVYIHKKDAAMLSDAALSAYDGTVCRLAAPEGVRWTAYGDEVFGLRVLHTPGHTAGSVCLYDEQNGRLFSGDTLFRAGFGRTDLPTGSMHALLGSLRGLLSLPRETVVYPGHGESTTIGAECARYNR